MYLRSFGHWYRLFWIGFLQSRIIKSIDDGYPIPKTIGSLSVHDTIQQDQETADAWRSVGEDLLFPLQANEEQKEIARRLANDFGVVVQGPPGTGKSHTIAESDLPPACEWEKGLGYKSDGKGT